MRGGIAVKYFDFAATTPVDHRVFEAMKPYFEESFFNASGLYSGGRKNASAIEGSREKIKAALHTDAGRVIFTSGGTESDNLAIMGSALKSGGRKAIAVSAIEHHAVLESAEALKAFGLELRILPVDSKGLVDLDAYKELVDEDVFLVSVMMANNELGIIQDIPSLASYAHSKGALFHTDAVQAFPAVKIEADSLGADMISLSSHKIYGPKGCGALWVKDDAILRPMMHGGQQEDGYRGGTENVPAIVGFGKAAELLEEEREKRAAENEENRRLLLGMLLNAEKDDILVNTDMERSVPGILNVAFKDAEAEGMLFFLNREGISVSMGSACNSKSVEPSHVVRAIGVPEDYARGCIRLSFGCGNTKEDVEELGNALIRIYRQMRR